MTAEQRPGISLPLPLTELTAISPIDGRYRERTEPLAQYTSEFALIKTRMEVEAKYLIALSDVDVARPLKKDERARLSSFGGDLSLEDAQKVKQIENETRHDVKAMERTFRTMLAGTSMEDLTEMVHMGLTSEDVNNISYRLMLQRATNMIAIPAMDRVVDEIIDRADKYKAVPMLARTHGQAAVPTTVGKELSVFASRANREIRTLEQTNLRGKLTGAVGNLNALVTAYPEVDWIAFSAKFVESFGLEPNLSTTQIAPYEDIAAYFHNYMRLNRVFVDFDQDMWRYISDGWIMQEARPGEVGSSTMPQKVNPIDFENSEGNFAMANGVFATMADKLQVSRLQRDLSDSTVIRNLGVPLAYSLIGYTSILAGLPRTAINITEIAEAVGKDWSILAEPAQTIMRTQGIEDPYTMMSDATRGKKVDEAAWKEIVRDLDVSDEIKTRLLDLTPQKYIGSAIKLTEMAIDEIKASRKA